MARRRAPQRNTQDHATTNEALLTPWLDNLGTTEYESKEQRLHDEIVAFVTYVTPTPSERAARELVVATVREIIRRRFPRSEVSIIGSVAHDLYLPNGDIDLVVFTPQVYDDKFKTKALFQLASMLKNAHVTFKTQVAVGARVPVLSFQTVPSLGSFQIDISLNADDGLRATPIIKGYLTRMPTLRPLILVVKTFMSMRGLNSPASGGLGSYAIICMMICFVQLNPKGRPPSFYEEPMASESLGYLLFDFFQFYAFEFSYQTLYISTALGKVLPKDAVDWLGKSRPDALCIECLVNPGRDIGKSANRITQIRAALQEGYTSLKNYPFSLTRCNVLGSILGLSEQIVAHRHHIEEIVSSGRLEREQRSIPLPPVWSAPSSYRGRGSRAPYAPHPNRSYQNEPYARPQRPRR
ncbi:unnamed protein product [Somion occarium]|uniref:polynucleotide adenylyltransferase n=1 Tax=Somion occarium TaxID=3059160 RepID=A0ABP1CJB2_9APHY